MKLLLACASATLVAGWNHLASFNAACGAELSILRGTEFEASAAVGKVPYQFKTAMQETLKARVATEGCTLTPQQQQLFYGLEPINFLRLFDAYDTELNNTAFPCTNVGNLSWSWQNAKRDIKGIELPTSCRSANFATSKQCNAKFRIVDNLFVEIHYADKCTDASQAGYGLPQVTLSCSGSMCASFGMPCVPGVTTCGGGATCHSFTDTNLADAMGFLVDTGLFNNVTDNCATGGFNFAEQFFSDIINNAANMLGLTTTLATDRYSSLSLCGVGEVDRRFNPSQAPTPAPMFRCNAITLPFSKVCDGVNDCAGNEDELYCRCNSTYPGQGIIDTNTGFPYSCCPVCPDHNDQNCQNYNSFCASQQSSSVGIEICNQTSWGLNCPDLMASTAATIPAAAPLSYVQTAGANEHLLGFADCDGTMQLGNTNDLLVANGRVPFQKVAARLETILQAREPCRTGTAVTDWARYFFPWAVNFWGGIFFTFQSAANIFGNANPGAKLDDSLRYYKDAHNDTFFHPPFSNVYNSPTSCDATTTGSGVCELAVSIGDWFAGTFPTGWSSATTIHFKASSTCANSKLPQAILTCEGPCTTTAKSGCCMAKEPFVPATGFSCPAGYVLETLNSGITDFLFHNDSILSKDTTLMNFVTLVATRSIGFGNGAGQTPFISVGTGTNTQFCRFNGSSFGDNVEGWANRTVTDNCPYPPMGAGNGSRSCPQFLTGGGVTACGTSCVQTPTVNTCPACGCPQAVTPDPSISGAAQLTASLALLGAVLVF